MCLKFGDCAQAGDGGLGYSGAIALSRPGRVLCLGKIPGQPESLRPARSRVNSHGDSMMREPEGQPGLTCESARRRLALAAAAAARRGGGTLELGKGTVAPCSVTGRSGWHRAAYWQPGPPPR